jgi:recombination protein RecT
MMSAAQLGLEPNTPLGQAYLIPYKNRGIDEVQFQLGYKGLIDLAYRSGEVELVQAHIVYENDEFVCEYGLEPKLVHKPADSDRGEAIKVYAMFKTKSGGYGFDVMSMDDVRRHAEKYSQAYKSGFSPWKTNFEEMAKKTVLKRVLKYAPLKSDFVRAVVQDESIKSEISEDMYEVKNDNVFEAEFTEVDTETGEVTEG